MGGEERRALGSRLEGPDVQVPGNEVVKENSVWGYRNRVRRWNARFQKKKKETVKIWQRQDEVMEKL